jgi:hypothetical protein
MTIIDRITVYILIILIILITLWLSLSTVQSGIYDPRPWEIAYSVWEYHGYDVAICLDDMVFVRGAGPRAGERCRIILPDELKGDTPCL